MEDKRAREVKYFSELVEGINVIEAYLLEFWFF